MPKSSRFSPFAAMVAQFFGFGVAAGLWAGSVPFVSSAAHMTTSDLGQAFTLFTAAYFAAMTFGGKLLGALSPRRIILLALPANWIVLAGLLVATSAWQVTTCLTLVGLVMGLIDLVMNTEGTRVEADLRRQILARLHCFASLGTGLGALAGSVFALTIGASASIGLAAVALSAGFGLVFLATPQRHVAPAAAGGIFADYSTALLILGIVFGIGTIGETAAQIWSARLLAEQAPRLAVIAGIGVTFFAVCQAAIRFFGDRLRRMLGDFRLIAVSLGVATAGFAVVGLSTDFSVSVAGFALIGLGTAMQVPCIFAIAARLSADRGGAALALVATIAGPFRLIGPWAFGQIASYSSSGVAFSAIAGLFVVAVGLALTIQSRLQAAA